MLQLAHGLTFDDLYTRDGLVRLDAAFRAHLAETDADLAGRLTAARADPDALGGKDESALLLDLAPHLDDFVANLFGIGAAARTLAEAHNALSPLYACKRNFVQRRALKGVQPDQAATLDGPALGRRLAALTGQDPAGPAGERAFAHYVMDWLEDEAAHAETLDLAAQYAAWAVHAPEGQARHAGGVLFHVPHKLDPEHLIPLDTEQHGVWRRHRSPEGVLRRREGFGLTDAGDDLVHALDEANYCIWCHHQDKDSCSKGLREKAKPGERAPFRQTVFGVPLNGCPLEEKVSEMNEAKARGLPLSALALVVIDNPTCALTGHRICNDCMKACIYQKQEPVDIPQIETRTLKDVLGLPWGFEIYSLLTRWNPLDLRRPYPKPPSGRKVLVAGIGPAGITLAHHLLNDGHTVLAIDGLKIEPLAPALSGVDPGGRPAPFQPIRDLESLTEPLDRRTMAGFGGVAEYGITVRWDKNFLKIARLLLERRRAFSMVGGTRFGGTLTAQDAFAAGFDHVALCLGAGRPTILDLPNGLARGVRAASDFLMALQLTGAARTDSIASMQLRLPVVVVGGGLTAIDTATEALAYYPVQVEKFLARYEVLARERGEAAVRAGWTAEEAEIADEFVAHARALRSERAVAARKGRAPAILDLLNGWGGVTIAYRRRLIDSPSYTLNHEEVAKALEEGISFSECLTPRAVEVDETGHARALVLNPTEQTAEHGWQTRVEEQVALPARTILVAAGTQPNTVLGREDAGHFPLDGKYFQAVDASGQPVTPERNAKPDNPEVLIDMRADGRAVSFFGDLHPSFAGNVVKAMGGAKQSYPVISRLLNATAPACADDAAGFLARLNDGLRATVHEVRRLAPTIVEVVVRAPLAARAFKPGQFFRLQNFETLAVRAGDTLLAMEGLALTGAWVDAERGLVSTIVLEMGGSSDLCALLKPGEPVVLMGPTGTPTEIVGGETVALVGGGLGNAVLFSIGQALRAAGARVLYFAGYRQPSDRYKVEEIEAAADAIVWACDQGQGFAPDRPQDRTIVANIVEAMTAYAQGTLGPQPVPFADVERVICIGSDRMMAAVSLALHQGVLALHAPKLKTAIASINSPMQCMMKEICAQCLQPQIDPETGETHVVFSCFNQDQPMARVDFAALNQRLRQNAVQEKLTRLWVDRALVQLDVRKDKVA
jgi:NADPH-dependent glutamate synthase beta subunit-like oxidoreductase/NAD(P)H-flavin reductase